MMIIFITIMMESRSVFKDSTTQNFCRVGDTFSGDNAVGIFYFPIMISMKQAPVLLLQITKHIRIKAQSTSRYWKL